jgi:hypothetical protein
MPSASGGPLNPALPHRTGGVSSKQIGVPAEPACPMRMCGVPLGQQRQRVEQRFGRPILRNARTEQICTPRGILKLRLHRLGGRRQQPESSTSDLQSVSPIRCVSPHVPGRFPRCSAEEGHKPPRPPAASFPAFAELLMHELLFVRDAPDVQAHREKRECDANPRPRGQPGSRREENQAWVHRMPHPAARASGDELSVTVDRHLRACCLLRVTKDPSTQARASM